MRWIAFSFTVGLAGLLLGCHKPQLQAEPMQAAEIDYGSLQPDLYVADGPDATPAPATQPIDDGYAAFAPSPAKSVTLNATSTRAHRVEKGDTLYRLARQYYGDQTRWKDIYQANRSTLPSPHRLRVGQELTLP